MVLLGIIILMDKETILTETKMDYSIKQTNHEDELIT